MTSRWAATISRLARRNSSTTASRPSVASAATGWTGAAGAAGADCVEPGVAVAALVISTRWTGRRPLATGVPSAVRTRCPLTTQPGRRGTAWADTTAVSRPADRGAGWTVRPAGA